MLVINSNTRSWSVSKLFNKVLLLSFGHHWHNLSPKLPFIAIYHQNGTWTWSVFWSLFITANGDSRIENSAATWRKKYLIYSQHHKYIFFTSWFGFIKLFNWVEDKYLIYSHLLQQHCNVLVWIFVKFSFITSLKKSWNQIMLPLELSAKDDPSRLVKLD